MSSDNSKPMRGPCKTLSKTPYARDVEVDQLELAAGATCVDRTPVLEI